MIEDHDMKIRFILFGLTLAVICGCAPGGVNLVQSGHVTVEVVGKGASAARTEVYRDDGEIVVMGRVESGPRGGYVVVSFISSDGDILKKETMRYKPAVRSSGGPKPFPRLVGRHAFFEIRMGPLPPQGSVVRLEFIE